MPSVENNICEYNNQAVWDLTKSGKTWSGAWGDSEAQFYFFLYPRIRHFLPAKNILEIAPGFGRWTEFLLKYTESLTGVDLAEICTIECRKLFPEATFFTNDGSNLDLIPDNSVNFIFSFDSLVHADNNTLQKYIKQFRRIMTENSVAFIHHSNAKNFPKANPCHRRDTTVSVETILESCSKAELQCITQEVFAWGEPESILSDCLSIIVKPNSKFSTGYMYLENPNLAREAVIIKTVAPLYWSKRYNDQT